jgi:hypothetical protein
LPRGKAQQRYTHEETLKRREWNLSSNASAESVGDWDIKPEPFIEGILQLLASGTAVMLGSTMSGGAISITLYQGDEKQRRYVTDAIEWDDVWFSICQQARGNVAETKRPELRAVGD